MFTSEYIKRNNCDRLFLRHTVQSSEVIGNIIFCCTPVLSIEEKEIVRCYEPFVNYGFDVFAFDFYGSCKSDGKGSDLTEQTIFEDFDLVVNYIKKRSDRPIFLFAGTGIGGIIGQAYASTSNKLHAFAQYGQVNYRDTSFFFKGPSPLIEMSYRIFNGIGTFFPNLRINFPLPEYHGYNAKKENQLYETFKNINPNFFKMNIHFLNSLFYFVWDKRSPISKPLEIPTMVIYAKHDRYFPIDYCRAYFDRLKCEKQFLAINDCHSSYLFHSELIAKNVSDWFTIFSQPKVDLPSLQ